MARFRRHVLQEHTTFEQETIEPSITAPRNGKGRLLKSDWDGNIGHDSTISHVVLN